MAFIFLKLFIAVWFITVPSSPQLSSAQQAVALLRQDKEYLVKQVGDLGRRANMAEERCEALSHQLADVKLSKEKIYEQFLKSK